MLWIRGRWVHRTIAAIGLAWTVFGASFVHAQVGGGGNGGGGTISGGGGMGGGTSGGGGISGGTGGGGAGGAGGGTRPGGTGTGGIGGTSSGGSDQSNFLSKTYSNPLYMGRYSATSTTGISASSGSTGGTGGTSSSTTNTNLNGIGGFGQPSLGSSTGGAAGGRLGGTAGVSTNAGRGGQTGLNSGQGTQAQSTTRIAYSASLKFAPTPKPAAEVESALREVLGRSSSLTNPGAIEVSVVDKIVTIRGKVANDEERTLAEGLIRLAPGVREVKNELQTQ